MANKKISKNKKRAKTMTRKKASKNIANSKNKRSSIIVALLLIGIAAGIYLVVTNGYFGINNSEAGSKRYNKTYAAGKLANYKPAGFKYERGKLVSVASLGSTIRMPSKPGGSTIDGWKYRHNTQDYHPNSEGWVYLSKEFTIPKPSSKKPMAVYVCWRATNKNTTIKLRLSRGVNKVWTNKEGAYHINYTHRYENGDNRHREIACWGFYDIGWKQVIPRSHPQNETIKPGQYMKKLTKPFKAKLFIKVPEGGVEIASIKVFEPTKKPNGGGDYYERQNESEITN